MLPITTRKRKTNSINGNEVTKRKRKQGGLIVEGVLLPVRILSCKEGKPTQYGTDTLYYTFQHLESKEEFSSVIFENNPPAYIDNQIVDAVLPPDMDDYSLEDLVDQGLLVQVKFRTKGTNTFINVVNAAPLSKEYQEKLAELLEAEELQNQLNDNDISELEDELEDEMDLEEDELDFEDPENFEIEDEDE